MNRSPIKPEFVLKDVGIEFLDFITTGGEAEIWKVREIEFSKRLLAANLICVLFDERTDAANSQRQTRMQNQEVICWNKVSKCKNIVQYLSAINTVQEIDGKAYLFLGYTMPFAELGDLKKYLANNELKLDGRKELRRFLLNIASGVKFAHDVNVAHQDIKPENILLFQEGASVDPRIMDFGMSLTTDIDAQIGGTPEYMAPERFERGKHFSVEEAKRADIYSLGILFYEIIAGKLPFECNFADDTDRWEKMRHWHLHGNLDLHSVDAAVGRSLSELVGSMTEKLPSKRLELYKVVRQLEKQEQDSIIFQSTLADTFSVVRPDTYRWNPELHRVLGNNLAYCFIHCESPISDLDWLVNNLSQCKIYGYALYRVLGGFDYVLRVWHKRTYREALDQVFHQMQVRLSAKLFRFEVATVKLFKDSKLLAATTPQEALDPIAKSANSTAAAEAEALINKGLASSLLTAPKGQAIRFFVTLKASGRINEWARKALVNQFAELLKGNKKVKQLSMYTGDGDYSLLLKFRLEHFAFLRPVLDSLLTSAELARKDGVNVSFQTFAELDEVAYRESDDGSIVKEASTYFKENSS